MAKMQEARLLSWYFLSQLGELIEVNKARAPKLMNFHV
jgi:hypothetical protein